MFIEKRNWFIILMIGILLGFAISPLASGITQNTLVQQFWSRNSTDGYVYTTNSSDDVNLSENELLDANLSRYAGTNITWSGGQFHSAGVGGGGACCNPFDQDLNSTDSVDFNDITLNQFIIGEFGGTIDLAGDPWYLGGTSFELEHNFTVGEYILSDLLPHPTLTHDLGSGANRWNWLYVSNISADYVNATHELSTLGDIWCGDDLTVVDDITFGGILTGDGGGLTNITGIGYWNRSGTDTFLENSGDDVGIGDSTPINKLEVVGGMITRSALSDGYTAPSYGIYSEGEISVGDDGGSGNELTLYEATPSDQTTIKIMNADTGGGADDGYLMSMYLNTQFKHWLYENVPMVFATNDLETLRLEANGTVNVTRNNLTLGYYKLLRANLSDYAGDNVTWDGTDMQFDVVGASGSGNPFNQDLNTTDNATFTWLDIVNGINASYFSGDGGNLTNLSVDTYWNRSGTTLYPATDGDNIQGNGTLLIEGTTEFQDDLNISDGTDSHFYFDVDDLTLYFDRDVFSFDAPYMAYDPSLPNPQFTWFAGNAVVNDEYGGKVLLQAGQGQENGFGGELELTAGDGGTRGDGGAVVITAGAGGGTGTSHGDLTLQTYSPDPGVEDGDIWIDAWDGVIYTKSNTTNMTLPNSFLNISEFYDTGGEENVYYPALFPIDSLLNSSLYIGGHLILGKNSLINANLSTYAGDNLEWDDVDFQFDASASGNPFNQSLNTNDSVEFVNLNLTGNLTVDGNVTVGNLDGNYMNFDENAEGASFEGILHLNSSDVSAIRCDVNATTGGLPTYGLYLLGQQFNANQIGIGLYASGQSNNNVKATGARITSTVNNDSTAGGESLQLSATNTHNQEFTTPLGFETCVIGGTGTSNAPKFSFADFDIYNVASMQGDNDIYGLWLHNNPVLNLGGADVYNIYSEDNPSYIENISTTNITMIGNRTIYATENLTIGRPGDIILGDDTERDMYPNTTGKVNLGRTDKRFKDGWFSGKITVTGGVDPPYVLFNKETLQSILDRISYEIPKDEDNKWDGQVIYYDSEDDGMFALNPKTGNREQFVWKSDYDALEQRVARLEALLN